MCTVAELFTGSELVTLGFVLSRVLETCVFKFVLASLVYALTVFVFVILDEESEFTLELILFVSLIVVADVAFTFKISAKANSKKTEHIDFRLIRSPPCSNLSKSFF